VGVAVIDVEHAVAVEKGGRAFGRVAAQNLKLRVSLEQQLYNQQYSADL
jgi:hypothetical protein